MRFFMCLFGWIVFRSYLSDLFCQLDLARFSEPVYRDWTLFDSFYEWYLNVILILFQLCNDSDGSVFYVSGCRFKFSTVTVANATCHICLKWTVLGLWNMFGCPNNDTEPYKVMFWGGLTTSQLNKSTSVKQTSIASLVTIGKLRWNVINVFLNMDEWLSVVYFVSV